MRRTWTGPSPDHQGPSGVGKWTETATTDRGRSRSFWEIPAGVPKGEPPDRSQGELGRKRGVRRSCAPGAETRPRTRPGLTESRVTKGRGLRAGRWSEHTVWTLEDVVPPFAPKTVFPEPVDRPPTGPSLVWNLGRNRCTTGEGTYADRGRAYWSRKGTEKVEALVRLRDAVHVGTVAVVGGRPSTERGRVSPNHHGPRAWGGLGNTVAEPRVSRGISGTPNLTRRTPLLPDTHSPHPRRLRPDTRHRHTVSSRQAPNTRLRPGTPNTTDVCGDVGTQPQASRVVSAPGTGGARHTYGRKGEPGGGVADGSSPTYGRTRRGNPWGQDDTEHSERSVSCPVCHSTPHRPSPCTTKGTRSFVAPGDHVPPSPRERTSRTTPPSGPPPPYPSEPGGLTLTRPDPTG